MLKGPGRTAIRRSLHEGDSQTTWTTTGYHHRQGDTIHLRPMEGNYRKIMNRMKAQHGISPANRQTDRKDQCHTGTISTGIHQLPTGRLVWLPTTSRICIQQRLSGNHQEHTLFCKLRNKPRIRDDRSSDTTKGDQTGRNDSVT